MFILSGMKLGKFLTAFAFFHYTDMAGLLLFGEAKSIAFDETALKDLVFTVGKHTNFKLISRAPNAADRSRRH